MHHAFSYTSLPVFARPRRENAYSRLIEYFNKQRPNFVSLLHLDMVPRNSTPGGFAYIYKVSE